MKPMIILGISAFYHDSAICLLSNGEIIFAAQEERFSRIKNDQNFPSAALSFGLKQTGLRLEDIDHVAFYDKPLLTFDRLLETWLAFAPHGFSFFAKALPLWLKEKLLLPSLIEKGLQGKFQGPLSFVRHHESHAASVFFPSPFRESAILTVDGVGEWSTTTIGAGAGNDIHLIKEIRFPHSIGLLYSAFTSYLGFKINSGEYKVMGLAPYGRPVFSETIKSHLIDLFSDGSFHLNMKYFNFCQGLTMTNSFFHDLMGGPPRERGEVLTPRHMDLAASIQSVCGEVMTRLAREARRLTNMENLCLAGGVALNCVGNGLILRENIFKNIFIQPASGDAGGSLGAALTVWHRGLGMERTPHPRDGMKGSYLGSRFSSQEVRESLTRLGAFFSILAEEEVPLAVAQLLGKGLVIGLFQGAMEFGPRALGARSILGDPRPAQMQSKLNRKIKFRESFRPFAPAVLAERAGDYFDLSQESPYMLLVAPVAVGHRLPVTEGGGKGLDQLQICRSDIPAVTHVDFSARVQTLTEERNGLFYRIVKAFEGLTGCPLVVNTSFNIRGEPIVNTPEEAYRCFMLTDMDALVLENHILLKKDQRVLPEDGDYRQRYAREDESLVAD